jgi:hypothetical protein
LWLPDSNGTLRPISLPVEVINSLDRQQPATAPNLNQETLAAARWRAVHSNLLTNPDLTIEREEEHSDEKANVA